MTRIIPFKDKLLISVSWIFYIEEMYLMNEVDISNETINFTK